MVSTPSRPVDDVLDDLFAGQSRDQALEDLQSIIITIVSVDEHATELGAAAWNKILRVEL